MSIRRTSPTSMGSLFLECGRMIRGAGEGVNSSVRLPPGDPSLRAPEPRSPKRSGVGGGGFETRPLRVRQDRTGRVAYGQAYVLFSPSLVMSMVLPSRSSTLKIFG